MIISLKPVEGADQYDLAFDPSIKTWDREVVTALKSQQRISRSKFQAKIKAEFFNHRPSLSPPAIRYMRADNRVVVWERPPAYKSVSYTHAPQSMAAYDMVNKNLYRIPVPWQVYVLYLSSDFQILNLFMYYRTSSLEVDDTMLYYPALPNFYSNGRLCQASLRTVTDYPHTVIGACQAAYDMVWSSGFNSDTLQAFNQIWDVPSHQNGIVGLLGEKDHSALAYFNHLKFYSLNDVISWKYASFDVLEHCIGNESYLSSDSPVSDSHAKLVKIYYAATESA